MEQFQERLWWLGLDHYVTANCLVNPDADRAAVLRAVVTVPKGFDWTLAEASKPGNGRPDAASLASRLP